MARASKQKRTRRKSSDHPRGILKVGGPGFGFVKTPEGDYFVPRNHMNGAFDGDLVELEPIPDRRADGASSEHRRPKGKVASVIERAHETLIGRYEVADPFGVVLPADPLIPYDIFTQRADAPDVPDGALVRVRILEFPTKKTSATGVVEEVVGMADDPRLPIEVIIARNKLETSFSQAAEEEAAAATLDAEGALAEGYRDIRDRFTFTIDPADARDFDDALSLEPAPEGSGAKWCLGVHIADVSHYVPWDSSIDLDARRRATSVYLVDRVIPMLPPALSDDLCSLRPGEDRRCMTADLLLDEAGELVGYDLYPALMRSRVRLGYDEAQAIIEGADGSVPGLAERIRACDAIAKKLDARARRQGAIDFASTEAKVSLDEDGRPTGISLRTKTDATELIEQAMVLANETVARHLSETGQPCIYRVHEQPSPEALEALVPIFQEFPWFADPLPLRLMTGDPHAIEAILEAVQGRPEHELVSSLLLRAMKRAVYRPVNEGHYGLGLSAYCHFTSPIRRYPDLVVHRMLRAQLLGRPPKMGKEEASLKWLSEHSSEMERVADAAARESQECKMIEYLQRFEGERFSGVVSGVSVHGLFVRLECTAEGHVPIRSLGREFFAFDPERYLLVGEDTGKVWQLGQRVAVVLKDANPRTRKLELELA